MNNSEHLRVAEIFHSLQGEGVSTGMPTLFVRLAGCNLRCSYCDTAWAREEEAGREMTVSEILAQLRKWDCGEVIVTGGEPLRQPGVLSLLVELLTTGYRVTLETNGSYNLTPVPAAVVRSLDIKTPGSGEADSFLAGNLAQLRAGDQVKFICVEEADIDWSLEFIRRHDLTAVCHVILQPAWRQLSPAVMAERITASGLPVRLGLQLHKLIWGEEQRGV